MAWTCAPGFAPSRTVTYAIRTAANAPNFALVPGVNDNDDDGNDDDGNDDDGNDDDENENKNNTVVAPASLEVALDPSETATTGATVVVSVRDVADPDEAPTPDCDSRFDDARLASKGITRRAGVASFVVPLVVRSRVDSARHARDGSRRRRDVPGRCRRRDERDVGPVREFERNRSSFIADGGRPARTRPRR